MVVRKPSFCQYGAQLGEQLLETVPALKFLVEIKGIASTPLVCTVSEAGRIAGETREPEKSAASF